MLELQIKLQNCIEQNWKRFKSESYYEDLKKFDKWLNNQSFDLRDAGDQIPNTILHPAHWYASQKVCKGLVKILHDHSYTINGVLPGTLNAKKSSENENAGIATRVFETELVGSRAAAYIRISLKHKHDKFYFVEPPQIEIRMRDNSQQKIVICTSMKFVDEVSRFKQRFESEKITIITPQREKIDTHWDKMKEIELVEEKNRITNTYFQEIKEADKVLIWNPEKHGKAGYIGPNTIMEMAVAYAANKPIYLLEDPQDKATRLEALGMKPNILYGNIEKIFSNMFI